MNKRKTLNLYSLYIRVVIILSVGLLLVVNFNLINRYNQEEKEKLNNISKHINMQKNMIDKGMNLMFNSVYLQRGWIEDYLLDEQHTHNNFSFVDRIEYDSKMQVSSLDNHMPKTEDEYGNIILNGNIEEMTQEVQMEIENLTEVFRYQKHLKENSIFDFWSVYYSGNSYLAIYPFARADEWVEDEDELFNTINQSISQLNDIEDMEVYEKGWETDIFFDNTGKVIMFSKDLPVRKNDSIVGIICDNIAISNIKDYVTHYNNSVKVYIIDSSNQIIYENGKEIDDIKNISTILMSENNIDNYEEVLSNKNPELINNNYFLTSQLDNVNWRIVYLVPDKVVKIPLRKKLHFIGSINVFLIICIITVIKTLMKYNEKAKEIDNQKNEFLMMVSHDLKAPLSSMLGFTEMIKNKFNNIIFPKLDLSYPNIYKASEKIQRNIGIIEKEGERLTELIENLLDLSKLQSGKIQLRLENVDIFKLAKESFVVTEFLFEEKGLKYKVENRGQFPIVKIDKKLVMEVFVNLISNAVKYTEKGTITCKFEKRNSEQIICIQDTGIGIAKKYHKSIFNALDRLHIKENIRTRGSGLGLSICKKIIELHGGRIWVESEEGKGSSFYFSIPVFEGNA